MVEQAIGSDLHDLSSADMIQDGKPLKRFVINARSKEEMNFWVDGLIRWIDYFRTQVEIHSFLFFFIALLSCVHIDCFFFFKKKGEKT